MAVPPLGPKTNRAAGSVSSSNFFSSLVLLEEVCTDGKNTNADNVTEGMALVTLVVEVLVWAWVVEEACSGWAELGDLVVPMLMRNGSNHYYSYVPGYSTSVLFIFWVLTPWFICVRYLLKYCPTLSADRLRETLFIRLLIAPGEEIETYATKYTSKKESGPGKINVLLWFMQDRGSISWAHIKNTGTEDEKIPIY